MEQKQVQAPFLSIILPVYCVEPYLQTVFDALTAMDGEDVEYLFVDDCSPDGCPAMLDRFAREHPRVTVIHKPENQGQAQARNDGLERASGRYVWFLDPDDTVEPELLTQVRRSLQQEPAQVVLFGLTEDRYHSDGTLASQHTITHPACVLRSAEEIRKIVLSLERETLYGYPWNKIYERSYLLAHGIRFRKVLMIEDIDFNIKVFEQLERLTILDCAGYHYGLRDNASTTKRFIPNYFALHEERVRLVLEQQQRWGQDTPQVRTVLAGIYCRYLLSALERNGEAQSGLSKAQQRRWLKDVYQSPLFLQLKPYMQPDSRLIRVFAAQFQAQRVTLPLLESALIRGVKRHAPGLFDRAKRNR